MFSTKFEKIFLMSLGVIGGLALGVPRFDNSNGLETDGATDSNVTGVDVDATGTDASQPETEAAPEDAAGAQDVPNVDTMRFDGTTLVIAGTAKPDVDIIIRDARGTEVARGRTDAAGQFAITSEYSSPEDGAVLQVYAQDQDGTEVAAAEALTILPQDGGETATANLTEDGVEVDAPKANTLALGKMSYGADVPWVLSGTASANAVVDLFVNGEKIGTTQADENGNWSYEGKSIEPGTYELGLAENGGEIVSRSLTLQDDLDAGAGANTDAESATADGSSSSGQSVTIGDREYVVQRGDSLWRIAERYFGEGQGDRYTEIFDLNASQINNPDLIYPDQEIEIPGQ